MASCTGSPGNPYIGQLVTWNSSVTGGLSSYSYSWNGDEELSGATATMTKSYASPGVKQATVTITDTVSGQTTNVACRTGANQSNGPMSSATGGLGVSVGSCLASLSADPGSVEEGTNTSFTWSVTGGSVCASACSGLGFNTGGAISGTGVPASILPAAPSTSYSLTCTAGTYGPPPSVNATVLVTIPAPVITINGQSSGGGGGNVSAAVLVNPSVPNNVVIAWEPPPPSVHVVYQSCVVTKNGVAWRSGLSSPGVADTVTTQTTYTVDCQDSTGKHAAKSILVNVLLNYQEF